MSEAIPERCPYCNSGDLRSEPAFGPGHYSFSCGIVFRPDGKVAYRFVACYARELEWLREQLDQLRGEAGDLRRQSETLRTAVESVAIRVAEEAENAYQRWDDMADNYDMGFAHAFECVECQWPVENHLFWPRKVISAA